MQCSDAIQAVRKHVCPVASQQRNGPPDNTAMPVKSSECDKYNCCAKNPPDENPDIAISLRLKEEGRLAYSGPLKMLLWICTVHDGKNGRKMMHAMPEAKDVHILQDALIN